MNIWTLQVQPWRHVLLELARIQVFLEFIVLAGQPLEKGFLQ